jgi:PiT family inorganic phosphate transporter
MSSAIMGVGAAERLGKVHWNVMGDLLTAWLLTIPACAAISLLLHLVIFH